ncbi:hypothetical protein [Microbulbifer litoralis]|uniref:hypothetical protein n=1 Tax=Microbulbifer litoralis TaxID=2933965 RepID=UPI002028873F|nr:hypothetical protein [Microbulbifer sp. GX H0434]
MSGQEMYQVVSAGKTLRSKPPLEVVQEAVRSFSIPAAQAKRLLLKGWVIKDGLTSKQVVEYQTRLQKIGLRVDVFPAGRFDNGGLVAKLEFAQKRRARSATPAGAVAEKAPAATAPQAAKRKPGDTTSDRPAASGSSVNENTARARAQVQELFADEEARSGESLAGRLQLLFGALAAALVPSLFACLALLCSYSALRSLWRLPQSILAGEFGPWVVVGCIVSLSLIGFVAALLLWPLCAASRFDTEGRGGLPLARSDARGLYLLLEVLAEKTGLPVPAQLSLHAGAEVKARPLRLKDLFARRLNLDLGLAAVSSLSGSEFAALVARAAGVYSGRLRGVAALLALGTARRLQWMQWALENGRTIAAPDGGPAAPLRPLHRALGACGSVLVPVVERLLDLHCSVTAPLARQLEYRGDACAARVLGSDGFVRFAEKWHQLVHAELVVAEINREAAIAGQRLADYPEAVHWTLQSLDDETRSNIELAMAQTSDAWDSAQAADNERIARVEDLQLPALVEREFSVQKLVGQLPEWRKRTSAAIADAASRPVDNRQLLQASREAEQSLQVLGEYFNRVPLQGLLPDQQPASEELAAMDLQAAVDWLRGKLVEVRDLQLRVEDLRGRSAAIQLGAGLIRAQVKIEPRDFFLSGGTPAAADESLKDNRARREEAESQLEQVFRVFYLRVQRAVESMPAGDRPSAQRSLQQLEAYRPLAAHLDRLDHYATVCTLMIDNLNLDAAQWEPVQKFYGLAAKELQLVAAAVEQSTTLRELGLAEALQQRVGGAEIPDLPAERQGQLDALQVMELRCKNAGAAIGEHYRIQLAQLLQRCLQREAQMNIRPLRLAQVYG